MKNRVLISSVSIFLLLAVILSINSAPKEKVYLNKDNIEANKSLAIYIEQENGSYNKTTTFPGKEDGYTLNTSKSVCNGSTNISWDKESWGIELSNIDREETKCYLYFDIYVPTASETILSKVTVNEGTPDFSKVATTDEGVFKADDPMYGGTSYYWRGAATSNHVIFANKCWRIVRINGDGSIRLIYNGAAGAENKCAISPTDSVIYSSIAEDRYYATSGGAYNNSSYVGWSFTVGSQRPTPSTGGTESNAKVQTELWFNNNANFTEAQRSQVAEGKYCNDRRTQNNEVWTATGTTQYYAAYKRIFTDYKPTLECDTSDIYTLKVGAITADEVSCAGGKAATTNNSYYLGNSSYAYWTMSPYRWTSSNSRAGVFVVYSDGYLDYNNVDNAMVNSNNPGLRPVINLKPDTIFTEDGDGTLDHPYVVS